jgi:amino-acid N-acetyltransferase
MEMLALRPQDTEAVARLLAACALPTDDLTPAHLRHFWGYRDGDALVGVVGLEMYDRAALLRSLAVAPSHRGRGLGQDLVRRVEAYAEGQGVEEVYLLTTTAASFFGSRGYEVVPRDAAPASIRQTTEFTEMCPSQAVCMTKLLQGTPRRSGQQAFPAST